MHTHSCITVSALPRPASDIFPAPENKQSEARWSLLRPVSPLTVLLPRQHGTPAGAAGFSCSQRGAKAGRARSLRVPSSCPCHSVKPPTPHLPGRGERGARPLGHAAGAASPAPAPPVRPGSCHRRGEIPPGRRDPGTQAMLEPLCRSRLEHRPTSDVR